MMLSTSRLALTCVITIFICCASLADGGTVQVLPMIPPETVCERNGLLIHVFRTPTPNGSIVALTAHDGRTTHPPHTCSSIFGRGGRSLESGIRHHGGISEYINKNLGNYIGQEGAECFSDGFVFWHAVSKGYELAYIGGLTYNRPQAAPITYYLHRIQHDVSIQKNKCLTILTLTSMCHRGYGHECVSPNVCMIDKTTNQLGCHKSPSSHFPDRPVTNVTGQISHLQICHGTGLATNKIIFKLKLDPLKGILRSVKFVALDTGKSLFIPVQGDTVCGQQCAGKTSLELAVEMMMKNGLTADDDHAGFLETSEYIVLWFPKTYPNLFDHVDLRYDDTRNLAHVIPLQEMKGALAAGCVTPPTLSDTCAYMEHRECGDNSDCYEYRDVDPMASLNDRYTCICRPDTTPRLESGDVFPQCLPNHRPVQLPSCGGVCKGYEVCMSSPRGGHTCVYRVGCDNKYYRPIGLSFCVHPDTFRDYEYRMIEGDRMTCEPINPSQSSKPLHGGNLMVECKPGVGCEPHACIYLYSAQAQNVIGKPYVIDYKTIHSTKESTVLNAFVESTISVDNIVDVVVDTNKPKCAIRYGLDRKNSKRAIITRLGPGQFNVCENNACWTPTDSVSDDYTASITNRNPSTCVYNSAIKPSAVLTGYLIIIFSGLIQLLQ